MFPRALVVAIVLCLLLPFTKAWGAPAIPIRDADMTVGVASWASTAAKPMILAIKQVNPADNTKTITTNVSIPNIPAFVAPPVPLFVKPARNPGENIFAYQMRCQAAHQAYLANNQANYINAWNAASRDKADKIAAAINNALGAGAATSAAGPMNPAGYSNGIVTITNCQGVRHGIKSNTTGEVGDGVKFRQGSPGISPYSYSAAMGSPTGLAPTADGVDPFGNSSIIEFGISGTYVASWFPDQGDSIDTILSGLQTLLESDSTFTGHGYTAAYDTPSEMLTITGGPDGNFLDGSDPVYWSMTDMALDGELGATFSSAAPESVPEPASLCALGMAAAALLIRRRPS